MLLHLEEVLGDGGQACCVVGDSVEIFVVSQNCTKDVQEKLQRKLVEEMNLKICTQLNKTSLHLHLPHNACG